MLIGFVSTIGFGDCLLIGIVQEKKKSETIYQLELCEQEVSSTMNWICLNK